MKILLIVLIGLTVSKRLLLLLNGGQHMVNSLVVSRVHLLVLEPIRSSSSSNSVPLTSNFKVVRLLSRNKVLDQFREPPKFKVYFQDAEVPPEESLSRFRSKGGMLDFSLLRQSEKFTFPLLINGNEYELSSSILFALTFSNFLTMTLQLDNFEVPDLLNVRLNFFLCNPGEPCTFDNFVPRFAHEKELFKKLTAPKVPSEDTISLLTLKEFKSLKEKYTYAAEEPSSYFSTFKLPFGEDYLFIVSKKFKKVLATVPVDTRSYYSLDFKVNGLFVRRRGFYYDFEEGMDLFKSSCTFSSKVESKSVYRLYFFKSSTLVTIDLQYADKEKI